MICLSLDKECIVHTNIIRLSVSQSIEYIYQGGGWVMDSGKGGGGGGGGGGAP